MKGQVIAGVDGDVGVGVAPAAAATGAGVCARASDEECRCLAGRWQFS